MKILIDKLLPFETIPPDKSLIESVALFGQLVPILVTQVENTYEVRDGKRRVEALKQLGIAEVEAVVHEIDSNFLTLIGNLQRSSNPIAEGEAIQALLDQGMSKEKLRDIVGIPLHKIHSRLWLYSNLHPDLKQKMIDGKMSCEAGRLAARLTWVEQKELAGENDKIPIKKAQSVRRANQLALLDLESVTIPKVSELDSILDDLTRLCTKIPSGWERDALLGAIKAVESMRNEER